MLIFYSGFCINIYKFFSVVSVFAVYFRVFFLTNVILLLYKKKDGSFLSFSMFRNSYKSNGNFIPIKLSKIRKPDDARGWQDFGDIGTLIGSYDPVMLAEFMREHV